NDLRASIGIQPGGRFIATATLRALIGFAYDLRPNGLSGGPSWIDSIAYHIEAKADGTIQPPVLPKIQGMLQSLLTDRFKLAIHRESREEPVYELLVAKGGSKLKQNPQNLPPRLGN